MGGGAAGFFAAIAGAEAFPQVSFTILERTNQFLSKVRISGGGRCNVTHACFDSKELSARYPRGGSALAGAFRVFQSRDTVSWFEARGVKLKTEPDGRMFPVTNTSETIVECLMQAATQSGVRLALKSPVDRTARDGEGFQVVLSNGETVRCDRLMLATGGCRAPSMGDLAVSLGHTLEPPVPSLFAFLVADKWLRELAGIAMDSVEVSVPGSGLRERGAILFTHQGLSGPAILRLSAWGARKLHDADYRFPVHLNWVPGADAAILGEKLRTCRNRHPARWLVNTPFPPLPARLWEALVLASGIRREKRWADLSRSELHHLTCQLQNTRLQVSGKSLNKEEFVTCGGVPLKEVNFKSMESRVCPGLYFGGELLDIDGITGGFNFQAAWTTGWVAGRAIGAFDGSASLGLWCLF